MVCASMPGVNYPSGYKTLVRRQIKKVEIETGIPTPNQMASIGHLPERRA